MIAVYMQVIAAGQLCVRDADVSAYSMRTDVHIYVLARMRGDGSGDGINAISSQWIYRARTAAFMYEADCRVSDRRVRAGVGGSN